MEIINSKLKKEVYKRLAIRGITIVVSIFVTGLICTLIDEA